MNRNGQPFKRSKPVREPESPMETYYSTPVYPTLTGDWAQPKKETR